MPPLTLLQCLHLLMLPHLLMISSGHHFPTAPPHHANSTHDQTNTVIKVAEITGPVQTNVGGTYSHLKMTSSHFTKVQCHHNKLSFYYYHFILHIYTYNNRVSPCSNNSLDPSQVDMPPRLCQHVVAVLALVVIH